MQFENDKLITKTFKINNIKVTEKFVELTLEDDKSEKMQGFLKDNISVFSSSYNVGEKIVCHGKIRKLRKNVCLDIIWLTKKIEEITYQKFDASDYEERFIRIIENIEDVDYKKILTNCFNEDVLDLFFSYPASKNSHHAYNAGLLKHSVEVVEISLLICNYYKGINKDLLCCAGLLHDIGKLKSYDIDDTTHNVTETDWEKKLGHAPMSALFVSKILTSDIPQEKALSIYDLVLNHHNEMQSKEGFILNKANEISQFFD